MKAATRLQSNGARNGSHHTHAPDAPAGRVVRPAAFDVPQFVVCDEFLSPAELERLRRFALKRRAVFEGSGVIAPTGRAIARRDEEHRRSRVLYEVGPFQRLMEERIRAYLPYVLERLGRAPFEIAEVEAQITASNHGDFFHAHTDNGQRPLATRALTFVYFFHREPKPFSGGELRIYSACAPENERTTPYSAIIPTQNRMVFFPSCLLHEVMTINCPSREFADSRFTLNGWLRR